MIPLEIIMDGEGKWPDINIEGDLQSVAALPHGTESGKPTVGFKVVLPDGKVVFAQTTLSLFLTAGDAFKARYGDPR